jgi:ABC-2 type transport system ATP-binding protein
MIWDLLLDLKREKGRTIILVTHNVLEAERVIERVGIIDHGKVVAWGTPGQLKSLVDDRVHLELTLAEGQEEHGARIAALGSATRVTDRHWVVLAERHAVRGVMDRVLGEIGIDRLDDFRLTTPSLEDVYLQLAGESLEDA